MAAYFTDKGFSPSVAQKFVDEVINACFKVEWLKCRTLSSGFDSSYNLVEDHLFVKFVAFTGTDILFAIVMHWELFLTNTVNL